MQDFVQGTKELLDYAATHGGSTLLSWYTFFYIGQGILGLLFCSLIIVGMVFGVISVVLSCWHSVKEDKRNEALYQERSRARQEEHELYKNRMNDREQRYR